MKIVIARRISQAFFLFLFLWFCIVTTFGTQWWQLRGWPVNWFLQLDPLVAVGTVLATGTLYAGLAWALVTIALTLVFGRFFCGWVCPFGTIHHAVGYLGSRGKPVSQQVSRNRYHWAQSIKYIILIGLLSAAGGALLARLIRSAFDSHAVLWLMALATIVVAAPGPLQGGPVR